MARQIKTELVVKDRGTKTIKKFSDSAMGAMKSLAGPLAIGAVTAGFMAMMKSTIDYGDQLQKLNLRLGVNVNQMDKLRKIAELAGVPMATLSMAMQRMTRRLQDAAAGGGPAADAIKRLGLDAKELIKLRADEQFRIIATQLDKVKSSGEKVALAFKLFDSEGVRVVQMTKNLNQELEKTNSNWTQEKADQAANFNDEMTKFKESMRDFAVEVLPMVTSGMNALITATKFWAEILRNKTHLETYEKSLESLRQKMKENAAEQETIQKRLNNPSMFDKATFASARLNIRLEELRNEFKDNERGAIVLEKAIEKLRIEMNMASGTAPTTPLANTPLGQEAGSIVAGLSKKSMKHQTLNTGHQLELAQEGINKYLEMERQKIETLNTLREQQYQWSEDSDKRDRESRSNAMKELIAIEKDAAKEREEVADRAKTYFADQFSNAFGDMITGAKSAKDAFKDMAKSIISDLARMAAKKAIMSMFSMMGGGAFGSIGSIFGMASGGPVAGNRPYIVGERGPELFVPNSDGNIIPNHKMGGGGGNVSVAVNVDASNSNLSDSATATRVGTQIAKAVKAEVMNIISDNQRYGGLLYTGRRRTA